MSHVLTYSQGIKTLSRHSFDSPSATTSQNALRCLANALFLRPACRQTFADLGYGPKACEKLKNDNRDDEFLVSRVLLLSTYTLDFGRLLDDCDLAATVVKNLARHSASLSSKPSTASGAGDPMAAMALAETVKLLFSITTRCAERRDLFTGAAASLASMVVAIPSDPRKPLDPPVGSIVNALSNLDLANEGIQDSLFPKDNPSTVTARLVRLLEQSTSAYRDSELEVQASTLIQVLMDLYAQAPDDVRKEMRDGILPTAADRKGVLGRGNSPSARLLQNTTNPLAPSLSQAISHLLFDLSDRNATQFIENVGYGFASGFLFQNKIPVPPSATAAASSSGQAINPITGQLIDMEAVSELPEMTDEEKEREAERLFVLFERYVVSPNCDMTRAGTDIPKAETDRRGGRPESGREGIQGGPPEGTRR